MTDQIEDWEEYYDNYDGCDDEDEYDGCVLGDDCINPNFLHSSDECYNEEMAIYYTQVQPFEKCAEAVIDFFVASLNSNVPVSRNEIAKIIGEHL